MAQTPKNERKVVLTIPRELGLSEQEIDQLKTRFQNDMIQSISKTALTKEQIVIVVVVVYV